MGIWIEKKREEKNWFKIFIFMFKMEGIDNIYIYMDFKGFDRGFWGF